VLTEIGAYLATKNVGQLALTFFRAHAGPADNCVSLFEYPAAPRPALGGEYPGLQVRVRNKSYAAARAKIGEIAKELHGLHEQMLSGTRYLLIKHGAVRRF